MLTLIFCCSCLGLVLLQRRRRPGHLSSLHSFLPRHTRVREAERTRVLRLRQAAVEEELNSEQARVNLSSTFAFWAIASAATVFLSLAPSAYLLFRSPFSDPTREEDSLSASAKG